MNEKEQVTAMVDYMKMSHDLDVALGENREHIINLQKACARINQLEKEVGYYREALIGCKIWGDNEDLDRYVESVLRGPIPATLK